MVTIHAEVKTNARMLKYRDLLRVKPTVVYNIDHFYIFRGKNATFKNLNKVFGEFV